MNTKKNIEITNLLFGQLTRNEINRFFKVTQTRHDAHANFNSESILESQIYTLCSNHPNIKGLETEEEWKILIQNATKAYSSENETKQTDKIKQLRLDNLKHKKRPFSYVKYLIAACLIGSIVLSGLIPLLKIDPFIQNATSTYSSGKNVNRISTVQSIANIDVVESKNFQTDTGNGLLYIDKKTAGFISTNTKMTYAKKDTSVFLDVTSGSVLFTVEKGKYRKFTIITPFAKINVTGTVFRVDAQDKFTKVSVIEGSVTVHHAVNNSEVKLLQGNIAIADTGAIKFFESEKEFSIQLPERKLLDAFLESSVHAISNDILLSDKKQLYKLPPFQVKNYLVFADSLCDQHLSKHTDILLSKIVSESRTYEKKSMVKPAIDAYNRMNLKQLVNDSIHDILQFRRGALSLLVNDTTNCLKHWSDYQVEYPTGIFAETVFSFIFSERIEENDLKRADSLLKSFTNKNDKTIQVERFSFCLAENLRAASLYERSLYWYEFILDNYSDTEIRNQAAYWVGWSIIQLRTLKTEAFHVH